VAFHDGTSLEFEEERVTDGYGLHFSAVEAARVIAEGGVESKLHPASTAAATLATMDEIRRQLGIVFPGD
jgi:hypothetical protein